MEQKYSYPIGLLLINIICKNDIHQVKGYGGRIYLNSKLDKCSLKKLASL